MGCGGRVVVTGSVFRMYVRFTDVATGRPVELDEPTSKWFVGQIETLVGPGAWIPNEKIVLVRGPIRTTEEAHALNSKVNRVLRGLRVKEDRTPTGVIGHVVENQGPAVDGSTDRGRKHGPSSDDDDPSAP
jgi:hypothetical protein